MSVYIDTQDMLNEFEANMQQIYSNQIPQKLITKAATESTVRYIEQTLHEFNIPLQLPRSQASQIYAMNRFAVARQAHNLYIMLEFPLSPLMHDLMLYRVLSVALPVDDQNLHSSILLNLLNYIAWSADSDWYLEFSEHPILDDGLYYLHTNPTALQHKNKPTCMLALLELGREEIQEYCSFAI